MNKCIIHNAELTIITGKFGKSERFFKRRDEKHEKEGFWQRNADGCLDISTIFTIFAS